MNISVTPLNGAFGDYSGPELIIPALTDPVSGARYCPSAYTYYILYDSVSAADIGRPVCVYTSPSCSVGCAPGAVPVFLNGQWVCSPEQYICQDGSSPVWNTSTQKWQCQPSATCPPVPEPCPWPGQARNNDGVCVWAAGACKDGFALNNQGVCERIYSPYNQCPDGWVLQNNGVCLPLSEVCPTCAGACPTGYARNNAGQCVSLTCPTCPAPTTCPTCPAPTTCPSPCATGYARNSAGQCVKIYPAPTPCPTCPDPGTCPAPDACPPAQQSFPWFLALASGLTIGFSVWGASILATR